MQHKHSAKVALATTLSLFVFAAGCDKSNPTASEDGAATPVVTEVKADAAEPVQAPAQSESTQPESASTDANAEKFFDLLNASLDQDEKAIQEAVGQEKTLALAQSTCQEFKRGKSFDDIANDVVGGLQSAGLSGEQLDKVAYYSGKVIGVGVAVFCPQYRSKIEG